ncbi:MAG: ankyrin repeat domain-containing protein [Gammaproteobacteria bacterium]|nr:ankyrin repeat domain-containing protein [Gammaproteobacteria bacterium]
MSFSRIHDLICAKKSKTSATTAVITRSLNPDLDAPSEQKQDPSYEQEQAVAHHALSTVNADVPSIVYEYLGINAEDLSLKDLSYLMICEDIFGIKKASYPDFKNVYLQKVKKLVLDIMLTKNTPLERETYSQILDEKIKAAPDLNQALDLLINQFTYHHVCQGRNRHTNPLNQACGELDLQKFLPLIIALLDIPGIDVNAYDPLFENYHNPQFNRTAEHARCAPIHNIFQIYGSSYPERDPLVIELIKALLAKGADINLQTSKGQTTVLHLAAQKASPAVISFLLSVPQIDILAKDCNGKSALELARTSYRHKQEEKEDVLKILSAAVKVSTTVGAKRTYLSYVIKKTLLGNSNGAVQRAGDLTGRAVQAVVGDFFRDALGPMGR